MSLPNFANPLALARYELRRFRGPLPKVALGFILLIPLLYGSIYLVGNWDPYGRLNHLPVAVVDEDVPATANGKQISAGSDFVQNLHAAGTFDFRDTDNADAEAGLRSGRYYLIIHVPSTFSADLVSGQTDDPQRAKITLRRNDANGFVIGSITNSAQNSIARAIDETAIRSYFEAVFTNLEQLRQGVGDAATGAQQVADGILSARDGATTLATGIHQAADASLQLADGATALAAGADQANAGATRLAAGLDQLAPGSAQVASGAHQVADGTQALADVADPVLTLAAERLPGAQARIGTVAQRADTLTADAAGVAASANQTVAQNTADLNALAARFPGLASDPRFQAVQQRQTSVGGTVSQLSTDAQAVAGDAHAANQFIQATPDLAAKAADARTKVDALNAGAHQVASGADQVATGVAQADAGAQALAAGTASLSAGATRLADGATQLHAGLGQADAGAARLRDGLATLSTGADKLAAGLKDAYGRMPALTDDQREHAALVLSSPVDVQMQVDNPAHVYGRGLAPLFFSIALWVFGISAFMLMRPITGRVLSGRATTLRLAFTAWLPMGGLGVVASWLMLGSAWVGLGLNPVHPGLMILLVSLVAIAFSMFAHFLRTSLGMVATAALLVVLIVQLTAAGGTYPPAILPPVFQALSPIMPMTYSIDAFRICISGGLPARLARDVAVLVGLAGASFLGLFLAVEAKKRASINALHPPLG